MTKSDIDAIGSWPDIAVNSNATGLFSCFPRSPRSVVSVNDRRIGQMSAATLDKYARDFALFGSWAIAHYPMLEIIPTSSALLYEYIMDLLTNGVSPRRVLSRIAAVQFANLALGHKISTDTEQLRRVLHGLYRIGGGDRQELTTLGRAETTAILNERGPPTTLQEYRDRALITIAWATALRRSVIASLRVTDVNVKHEEDIHRRVLEVKVEKRVSDGNESSQRLLIRELPGTDPLCAVRAVEAWINVSGISSEPNSPLFRSFTPRGCKIKASGISGRDLTLTLKRLAKATGRDESIIAANALRRGSAIAAQERMVSQKLVSEYAGWESEAMPSHYILVDNSTLPNR